MHNRDTRLAKLDAPDSKFSCILLATAGLLRLGLGHRITQRLDPTVFPYAVGQGALGLEVKRDREDILRLVRAASHKPSRWRGLAERAMLRSLQGGCSSPIGVWSSFEPNRAAGLSPERTEGLSCQGTLHLHATVLDLDGTDEISAEYLGPVSSDDEADKIGVTVANALIRKGASDLLSRQG